MINSISSSHDLNDGFAHFSTEEHFAKDILQKLKSFNN